MRFLAATLVSLFTLFTPVSSSAEVDCGIVIREKAFDRTNSDTLATIAYETKKAVCSLKWSTEAEMRQAAKAGNLSVKYASFELGAGGSGSSAGSRRKSFRDEFCSRQRNFFRSYYESTTSSIDARVAVDGWWKCIQAQNQSRVAFEYSPFLSTSVTGRFRRFVAGNGDPDLFLTGIKVTPNTYRDEVSCTIKNRAVQPSFFDPPLIGKSQRIKLGNNQSFECTKPSDKDLKIGFSLNQGDPIEMELLSQKNLSRIERLKMRVGELGANLKDAEVLLSNANERILRASTGSGCIMRDGSVGRVRVIMSIRNPGGTLHGYDSVHYPNRGSSAISPNTVLDIEKRNSAYYQKRWAARWDCLK